MHEWRSFSRPRAPGSNVDTCARCVESQVRHAADAADVRTRHKYAGRHLCASIGCTSEPIDDSEIARVTSRTTFAAFVEATVLLPTARDSRWLKWLKWLSPSHLSVWLR